ncbi:SsrA-binding protein SmpB [endosymbiont GvMRE of Glomus versiforme]|uniref:SsrA-binding protein SmpB n=1 Tax=endosymbiont GvMRE of Glomus versiforme TaxID=2039283 RepID=UPI000EDE8487|nr:SsrA-binding protein SmpB [endosymbiont GvMRE of Glomus versiforme]RHZ35590.1 SsrA-binding protein [endosymbiont GvMRE of Glomus versiforme]
MEKKVITQVRKYLYSYRIISKYVAGIVLTGNEIKSLRNYQVSISEAYVLPQKKELYIINMHIATYKCSYVIESTHSAEKKRKLLLKKREINKLVNVMKAKKYVLIPLQLFISSKGWAKLEIALAQHLRKHQIRKKEQEKDFLPEEFY